MRAVGRAARVALAACAGAAAAWGALYGCSAIFPIHEGVGVVADAGQGEAPCSPDYSSDPRNCGMCGHDCLGGACEGGLCQPWQCGPIPKGVFSGGNGIAVDDGGMYWAAGVSGLPTIYECPTLGCDGGTQPTIITTLPTKNGLGACSLFDAGIYCASGQLSTGEGFYRCPRAPDDAGCTLVLTIDHPRGIETYRDGFLWAADPDGGGEVGHCINGAKPCVVGDAAPTLLAGPVPGANEVHGSIEKGLAVWTVDGRDGGVYAYQFNMQITSTVASVPHALHVAADPLRQLGLMSTPDGIYAFGPPPSTAGSPLLVVDGGMDNWYLVADVDREEAWCFQRLPGYPIYRFAYTVPDAGLEQIAHAPAGPNAATGFGPLLYWTDDFGGVTCLAK